MKVTPWLVPALVVLFAALGLGGARFLAAPSVVREFAPAPAGGTAVTVFTVRGMKCVDTAQAAAAQLEGLPGVVRFTAYASRNRAEIAYDPAIASVELIRKAIEGPVHDKETGEYLFGVYSVIRIDDAIVHDSGR
jgi:copper chaperone CopZ